MFGGTAQKYGAANSEGRLGVGRFRRRARVSPFALTLSTSFASSAANDPVLGSSARSIARPKAAAVTGSFDGGEKRNPCRIRKV